MNKLSTVDYRKLTIKSTRKEQHQLLQKWALDNSLRIIILKKQLLFHALHGTDGNKIAVCYVNTNCHCKSIRLTWKQHLKLSLEIKSIVEVTDDCGSSTSENSSQRAKFCQIISFIVCSLVVFTDYKIICLRLCKKLWAFAFKKV